VRILAHEGGHNLGLNHANSDDFGNVPLGAPGTDGIDTEYGDPFSVMGVGEQGSSSLTTGQYSAQHKAQILGWLDNSSYFQVNTAGTYNIAPLEGTTGTRALRVMRDPSTQTWLWLESRQPTGQIDSSLTSLSSNLFAGAMIHYETPDLDPLHTYLLDFQPVSLPNNFVTSAMLPGQTWSDPSSLLSLTVNSAGPAGISVNVGYDNPCATATVTGAFIPLNGGSGSIQIAAPANCSWTVSTADTWLSVGGTTGGTTSGTGNGMATFSAAANPGSSQRNGFVLVGRQNFAIVQEGPGLGAISVSPQLGTGGAGALTFQFSDSNGYADINQVNLIIGRSPYGSDICSVAVLNPGLFFLLDDAGINFLGPVFSGEASTVSNSTCIISGAGSTISAAGDMLTVTLSFQATASVSGTYEVFAYAENNAGFSNPFTLGQWVFPSNTSLSVSGAASAASFVAGSLAPESIVALFGSGLAGGTESACCLPLPTVLSGTKILVTDAVGATRPATLYYASPTQLNFEIPAGTAEGQGTLSVQSSAGGHASLPVTVANSAPGVFVVNSSGLPAAVAQTFGPGGSQSVQDVYQLGPSNAIVPLPIDVTSGQVYLLLFGTGVRNAKTVVATVGNQNVPVLYAGPQGTFVGEDQINIGPLPASLAGAGAVALQLTADGVNANKASITIQ
jgi:uncharacterized protein (TIGR03437 family)